MNLPFRLPRLMRRTLASRLARPEPLSPDARHRRACIYKVDRLGDFVLALGALHQLVAHIGADQCRLVVSDVVAPLATREFPSVPLWEIPSSTSGAWRELRPLRKLTAHGWAKESFDELICLRHARSLHRDATLGWIHARKWRGLNARPNSGNLSLQNRPEIPSEYPTAANKPWSRELVANRLVLEQVLGRPVPWEAIRPRFSRFEPKAGRTVVFCPFGYERIRDYPESAWIQAWRSVSRKVAEIHLIGSREQESLLASLAHRLGTEACLRRIEIISRLSPPDFVRYLSEARAIATVDSAAAHIATALDKPATIVVGGGHFGRFSPWGDGIRQNWGSHKLDCFDCDWTCRHPSVRCLVDLHPAAVAIGLTKMLDHD